MASLRAAGSAAMLAVLAACAPAMDTARNVTGSFPNPLAVVTAPFAPPDDPKALIGHSGREVAGWLGEPQLKRRDPPAQMWQYRTPACVVDFFLYGATASNGATQDDAALSVSHVEVRPREANARACLSAIRAGERRATGG